MMFGYIRGTYMFSEAVFYNRNGEYRKSLEYIDKGLDLIGEAQLNPSAAIHINTLKGENMHLLGRDAEAYDVLKGILTLKDSIDNRQMSSQIAELQTIYEVNKIKTDMEVQAVELERTKVIVGALVGLSFLLLILILMARKNKKSQAKKNKKIYEQYQLMKSYLSKIREQRSELEFAKQEEDNSLTVNWAEKAHSYLIETEAFKNENLSRDDLAAALGTNRQYLIDAIKQKQVRRLRIISTVSVSNMPTKCLSQIKQQVSKVFT